MPQPIFRLLSAILTLLIVAGGVTLAWQVRSADREPAPAEPTRFDAKLVSRGAQLSAIGNCSVCHSAPGGASFAGGLPLKSAFGTLYSTNITPDTETGIGGYTQQEFNRALREGVDRRGRHLYPAFPYDHFTLVADDDLTALYAFLMTREPVRLKDRDHDLIFPFNVRAGLAAWKALYFRRGAFQADPSKDDEWNRGAYLVEGLGHCGACHTPRNLLGAEKRDQPLAGGDAEGWHAPALGARSPAPLPWTAERLQAYLSKGVDDVHGAAAGPMQPVVHQLSQVPQSDVRAMAVYVASLDSRPVAEREKAAEALNERRNAPAGASSLANHPGADIYAGACATCHGATRREHGALQLSLSTALALPTPVNLLRVIREGIVPANGQTGPWMPAFEGALTDQQTADLADYLRARFSDAPAWKDSLREARKLRSEKAEKEKAEKEKAEEKAALSKPAQEPPP